MHIWAERRGQRLKYDKKLTLKVNNVKRPYRVQGYVSSEGGWGRLWVFWGWGGGGVWWGGVCGGLKAWPEAKVLKKRAKSRGRISAGTEKGKNGDATDYQMIDDVRADTNENSSHVLLTSQRGVGQSAICHKAPEGAGEGLQTCYTGEK